MARRSAMAAISMLVRSSAMAAWILVFFILFVPDVICLRSVVGRGVGGDGSDGVVFRRSTLPVGDGVGQSVFSLLRGLKENEPDVLEGLQAENDASKGFAWPDYSIYHSREKVQQELKELVARHPDIMQMETLESTEGDYTVLMRIVTVELEGGLRREGWATKIRALLDFGQHGREIITTEVALALLKALAAEDVPKGVDYSDLKRFCQNMVIKIVPMENENGRRKVESGQLCERKNGRGVDTNRNWDIDWGKFEKDYDPSEEYPGKAPFSEPEASILRNLTRGFHPHVWVNVHSGMEALFMPYDHKGGAPLDGSTPVVTELLEEINIRHCGRRCKVGSGGGSVGYLAHGTATDYMYDVLKVPISLTWEIYGDSDAHNDDCFRMFNPTSREGYDSVVVTWTSAFITLLSKLPAALQRMPYHILPFHDWSSVTYSAGSQATKKIMESSDGGVQALAQDKDTTFFDPWYNSRGKSRRRRVNGVETQDHGGSEGNLLFDVVQFQIIGASICLLSFTWLARVWYKRRILQRQRVAGKKDALV